MRHEILRMTEGAIEQQAIRAALSLAATSTLARTPDGISDLREEATHLLGLCLHQPVAYDVFLLWCDDIVALLQRMLADNSLSEKDALRASAAVLRFRLTVARVLTQIKDAMVSKKSIPLHAERFMPSAAPLAMKEKHMQIIDFITTHPDVRTRELISGELGARLSVRTIKRCLKELSDAGMVHRTKLEDGGVSYRV